MSKFFEKVKKNFGFGCMRLPMNGETVNDEEFIRMADAFIAAGFNYFDTAHGYLGGESEKAVKRCVSSRYPREEFILTNKLSNNCFSCREDIRPFFASQLELCGVDYFDFYLMHAQNKELFRKYKACQAYETALELKAEGKIKHFGISFHDTADVLDEILTEYPQIEVVQIQLNYVDFDDPSVQSRLCYETCQRHGKPVIIMEPVKGGTLVNLPEDCRAVYSELGDMSPASYAIRFAAGFDGVMMVLSGMSSMEQMEDNLSYMTDFKPLDEAERAAVQRVCDIFGSKSIIPCTACRYCVDGCPMGILIPDLFGCFNRKKVFNSWTQGFYYNTVLTEKGGKASDCIKCGACEYVCPQHLEIRSLLEDVAAEFEK